MKGLTGKAVEALALKMGIGPSDRGWVTVDVGATLLGISPTVARDFFKVVPEVARMLENGDLRNWAEIGRRIAQQSGDEASDFFRDSVETLKILPESLRATLVALCAKQMVLSPATALSTFRDAPRLAKSFGDERAAGRLFRIAVEVAHRSVRHSSEVLAAAPIALNVLREMDGAAVDEAIDSTLTLAESFAQRTGATAAEFLAAVGEGVRPNSRPSSNTDVGPGQLTSLIIDLCRQTTAYLERGGATALQYFRSARAVIEVGGPVSYDRWNLVARKVADEGNAVVYDFLKMTPKVLATIAATRRRQTGETILAVLQLVEELAGLNVYVALECFKSSPRALAGATLDQFQEWAREGAQLYRADRRRAQAYYALESKSSQDALRGAHDGIALETVSHLLRLYVEGLTGRELVIAPFGTIPEESRIIDGQTIQLPAVIDEFGSPDDDFRLYKVLAAHAAGQIEFGTRAVATPSIQAALNEIEAHFEAREVERLKAETTSSEYVLYSNREHLGGSTRRPLEPAAREQADYVKVLTRFDKPALATRIFTTLENGRIDWLLRQTYRGIRRDLDFVRGRLIDRRPAIAELTVEQAIYEILFQITLCGGVIDENARRAYAGVIGSFEQIVANYLRRDDPTVGDTLLATFRVYELLESNSSPQPADPADSTDLDQSDQQETELDQNKDRRGDSDQQQASAQTPRKSDIFNQWSQAIEESAQSESELLNELMNGETGEQELQEGDEVFFYDEWDRDLGDHRTRWCRVIQRTNRRGSPDFVDQVRARYAGLISSIRHQFQMLRPESLRRIKGEIDGEEFDLQAVIDYHVDRRTNGRPSDRLYIRRIRRERDVAVSFLLDMSSSTARTISRHPNLPYTKPGQKIIDIEKQGLVLMSEALEAVGDSYSISGFSSEGRRNVRYFVMKRFDERYDHEVERRIGGITYHNNTRLGAAVRHATAALETQEARTRLLIILSDGRPYDHDYGDSRYAREDTRVALRQARLSGVTPFCITIDRDSEAELKDLYGEVGYTIIDDIASLPERLPGIYRRLTT